MSVLWQKSTHGVARRREATDRMIARSLMAVMAIIAVVAFVYLSLMFWNVRTAEKTWEATQDLMRVQEANQRLRIEIARQSSIPALQERSVGLGYQPAQSIEFVYLGAP